MRKASFIKFLETLSEEDLRKEVLTLFTNYKEVKAYYAMELGQEKDRERLFAKAKKDIKGKYATRSYRRPKRPRVAKINAILKEVNKISIFKEEMADLYLYNCECALDFIEEYQFHSDPLYNNIFRSFRSACDLIVASIAEEEQIERCQKIVDRGYDIYEYLGEPLQEIYNDTLVD